MSGNDFDWFLSLAEIFLQFFQRAYCQFVILCQCCDKAVPSISSKPDRVTGEEILVVDQVDQMSSGVSGYQDAFDPDIPDVEDIAILQQDLFVICLYHRQFI